MIRPTLFKFTASLALSSPIVASALPVQWTVAAGGNDHWYEVSCCAAWDTALASASGSSYLGLPGYLATVTSGGEDAFITALVLAHGHDIWWLGASDEGNEGSWTWRSGPELGSALTYTDWGANEPSDFTGRENQLVGQYDATAGSYWNDANNDIVVPYVTEFSAPVPEPTSAMLMLAGLCLASVAVRRQSSKAK